MPRRMSAGSGGQPSTKTSTGTTRSTLPTTPYPPRKTPHVRAQSPTATTSFGSGVASHVLRSGTSMLRVTGPVTSSRSAWRGEATKWMPKRSLSYTGPVRPEISSSQPLQEPASTSRIASARPSRRRVRASIWRRTVTTGSSPDGRGSVTMPVRKILANSTSAAPRLARQLAQERAGADQLVVEDPAGHGQQGAHLGIADRVPDRGPFLAGAHDVLGPENGELLRHH